MNSNFKHYFLAVLIFSVFLSYNSAFCQTKYEITPGISVGETYDDNIGLDNTNEVSDYITDITPSIIVDILSEKTKLDLRYRPSFVWYAQSDVLNTVRHAGTLTFSQALQKYFSLLPPMLVSFLISVMLSFLKVPTDSLIERYQLLQIRHVSVLTLDPPFLRMSSHIIMKRQPVPLVTSMAASGQLSWQAPHSIQRFSKASRALLLLDTNTP